MDEKEKLQIQQPDSVNFYEGGSYGEFRFEAYSHQVRETLKLNPQSVLVIGQGDNIVPSILRGFVKRKIHVDTFDFVEDMNPTYLGDVRQVDKIVKMKYDVILCCEVLEHIPFEDFSRCLEGMRNLLSSGGGVVLSLPVFGFSRYVKISGLGTFIIALPFYKPGLKVNCGEHHWEINDRNGVTKENVLKKIRDIFSVKKYYRAKDSPYHMFFILN